MFDLRVACLAASKLLPMTCVIKQAQPCRRMTRPVQLECKLVFPLFLNVFLYCCRYFKTFLAGR